MPRQINDVKVFVVLHNIRSALNVGSIFRTSDAVGISKVYICGHTPTPEHEKVKKTALGAEKSVFWEYHKQTWRLLDDLREKGITVVALEQNKKSIDYLKFKPQFPMALVLGNEVSGLNRKLLDYVDQIVALPMRGKKESLNVAVAFGVAVYKITERLG